MCCFFAANLAGNSVIVLYYLDYRCYRQVIGQTYPCLVHGPAIVFKARGSVYKAWISLLLKTPTPPPEARSGGSILDADSGSIFNAD